MPIHCNAPKIATIPQFLCLSFMEKESNVGLERYDD